jgi:mRNA interferase MazF
MSNPRRGEIWIVDWSPGRGSEQEGTRPSLILQSDKGNLNNRYRNTIVLAITTKGKYIPLHTKILKSDENGLMEDSYIKCEQIFTISKRRLIKRLGRIDNNKINEIESGVKMVLDFSK